MIILISSIGNIPESLYEAAKLANAHNFIMNLAEGYNTKLGDRGVNISGGQRQRVALGRAIVRNARIFLMDEPLSNLDAKLRVQMRSEIIRLHRQLKATTIYVTHDQTEAMTMADRIVVMKDGYVQQIGTPIEIYRHPANLFVASFIGSPAMNLLKGMYKDGKITFPNGESFTLSEEQVKQHDLFYRQAYADIVNGQAAFMDKLEGEASEFRKKRHKEKDVNEFNTKYDELIEQRKLDTENLEKITQGMEHEIVFGIRPEDISEVDASAPNAMKKEVKLSELLGDQYYVHFDFGGKDVLSKVISERIISANEDIILKINESKIHLFDSKTEKAIF